MAMVCFCESSPETAKAKFPEIRVLPVVVEAATVIVADALTAGLLVDVAVIVTVAAVEGAV
jgi:hypothetical protein